MCISFLIHVLPAIIIALSFIAKATRASAPKVGILMSIIGLVAGAHVHVDHAEAFELLDPCYFYAAFLAISSAVQAKLYLKKA